MARKKKIEELPAPVFGQSDAVKKLNRLNAVKKAIQQKRSELNPVFYGLPDLLFGQGEAPGEISVSTGQVVRFPLGREETTEEYLDRQDEAVELCIRQHLKVMKDGVLTEPELIPEMIELVADLFYGRVNKAILWANRGGGKSLVAAIIIWICLVYRRRSFVNMGGCVLPGEIVWTAEGWKCIEDVHSGDRVLGSNGFTAVEKAWSKPWMSPVVSVWPWGWAEGHTYTADHMVLAVRGMFRAHPGERLGRIDYDHARSLRDVEPEWVSVNFLRDEDAVAVPRPVEPKDSAFGGLTDDECRFLGYWAAEGSIYEWNAGKYIELSLGEDDGFIQDLEEIIRNCYERSPSVDRAIGKNGNSARVRFGHSELANWLEAKIGRGAHNKNLTALFSEMRDGQVEQVLIGLFRGDGCLKRRARGGWTLSFSTVSDGLSASVYYAALRLGYAPQVRREPGRITFHRGKKINGGPYWTVSFTSEDVDRLAPKVFPWVSHPVIERRPRPVIVGSRFLYAKVKKIRHGFYDGPVFDLSVPDGVSFGMPMIHAHNTGEQAKRVYEYTAQFWDCVPGLKKGMLEEDPLLKLTTMKGKTKLICCSGEQGVGEHLPGFVADEACTDKTGSENNIRRAMQGAFDNDDYLVLMLSTFHHPIGLFQETWDNAKELGYKQFRWTVYDTMQKCEVGMEEATPEDPWAQKYCIEKCPLTRLEDKRDDFGKIVGQEYQGCCGRARTSHGWQSRNLVLAKFESNKGTRLFHVEHECQRPQHEGVIYIPTVVDSCVVDSFKLNVKARKVVGIDWGLTQCAMILIGEWVDGATNGIGVIAARIMSNRLTDEVVKQLCYWQSLWGDELVVRADASHPYCNKELREKNYRVRTVKGDKDKVGEDNVQRWLSSGRFRILRELGLLVTQLKNLRRGDDGKQLKENRDDERGDHLPDALKFALMELDYTRWLGKFGGALATPEDYKKVANEED